MRRWLTSCALVLAALALVAAAFRLPDFAARRQDEAANGVSAYRPEDELQLTVGSGTTFAQRLELAVNANAVTVSDASQMNLTAEEVAELARQTAERMLPPGGQAAMDASSVQALMAWDGALERTVPVWSVDAELWSEDQTVWYGTFYCYLDDETGALLMFNMQNYEEDVDWLWTALDAVETGNPDGQGSDMSAEAWGLARPPEYALAAVQWMLGEDWTLEAVDGEDLDALSTRYQVMATRGEDALLIPVYLWTWGIVVNSEMW